VKGSISSSMLLESLGIEKSLVFLLPITPGVAFAPVNIGDTVLVLAPVGGSGNPKVTVEGVNAATGKVFWKLPQPLVLSDAPVVCGSGHYFCLPAFVSDTSTGLIAISPTTGAIVGTVQGPLRAMAVAPPGTVNDSALWQTTASDPTLTQTSTTGQLAYRLVGTGQIPGAFRVGGQWRISVPRFLADVHGNDSSPSSRRVVRPPSLHGVPFPSCLTAEQRIEERSNDRQGFVQRLSRLQE